MIKNRKRKQLPKRRQGEFLKFVDDTSLLQLIAYGLSTYVGAVLTVSVIEIVALKSCGVHLVEGKEGEPVDALNIIYFNFVTTLTVGYGDISPVGFGKVLSILEALLGVGLFAVAISILTVKALRPSGKTIVFSKYAYYCLDEQRFMVIFLNTSVARLENCSISSYFKLGRDWTVRPSFNPPFLTTAVQTFYIDEHSESEISRKLTNGDCLRVGISGSVLGSEVATSVQYKPEEIIVIQNRDFIASYEPFWDPDFADPKFVKMFHYRPEGTLTLAENFNMN